MSTELAAFGRTTESNPEQCRVMESMDVLMTAGLTSPHN